MVILGLKGLDARLATDVIKVKFAHLPSSPSSPSSPFSSPVFFSCVFTSPAWTSYDHHTQTATPYAIASSPATPAHTEYTGKACRKTQPWT